jgi:hypothetical protein
VNSEVLTIGIPLLAIIAGILFNRQDVASLRGDLRAEIQALRGEMRGEIQGLRAEMNHRFDTIQHDMREFYAVQAQHNVRIQRLEHPAKH